MVMECPLKCPVVFLLDGEIESDFTCKVYGCWCEIKTVLPYLNSVFVTFTKMFVQVSGK